MTFLQIQQDCFRRLNYPVTPDGTVTTRIKAFINEVHEEIVSHPSLRALLYGTMTFDSVASRARYGIATQAQVRSITDTANQQPLRPRDLAWYRARNPAPALNEGIPEWYIPLGIVAVQQVPATTGTGLWAASTSAADTGAGFKVQVEGIRVGGYPNTPADTNLNGVTRVQIGTLTDYIDVTQFALSAACAGDVSLYDAAAAGNVLAVIPRGATTSRYWGFLLCLTPSSALTYTVDLEHDLFVLTADTDEPLLPARFHRLLAMGARMLEYEKTENSRYGVAKAQFDEGMRDLLYQITCPPGFTVVPGGSTRDGDGSNLGPYFPSGRW